MDTGRNIVMVRTCRRFIDGVLMTSLVLFSYSYYARMNVLLKHVCVLMQSVVSTLFRESSSIAYSTKTYNKYMEQRERRNDETNEGLFLCL